MKRIRTAKRVGAAGIVLLVAGLSMTPLTSHAADPASADLFGSQMMTEQERVEQRERMRNARTQEERERVRAEHHERMKVRAKERGITLPDEPPMRRDGVGMGGGMGPGTGGGMGPGGGRGGR